MATPEHYKINKLTILHSTALPDHKQGIFRRIQSMVPFVGSDIVCGRDVEHVRRASRNLTLTLRRLRALCIISEAIRLIWTVLVIGGQCNGAWSSVVSTLYVSSACVLFISVWLIKLRCIATPTIFGARTVSGIGNVKSAGSCLESLGGIIQVSIQWFLFNVMCVFLPTSKQTDRN